MKVCQKWQSCPKIVAHFQMILCFTAQAHDRQNQSGDRGLRLLHLPPRPLLRPSSILLFQVGIRSVFLLIETMVGRHFYCSTPVYVHQS